MRDVVLESLRRHAEYLELTRKIEEENKARRERFRCMEEEITRLVLKNYAAKLERRKRRWRAVRDWLF